MKKRTLFVFSLAVSMFFMGALVAGCGAGGSSTSATAPSNPNPPSNLTPSDAVQFTQQPVSVTVTAGQAATFTATAVASDGSQVNYQWSVSGQPVSGATTGTFTIEDTKTAMSGENVTVTADAANDPVTASATLIVTPAADPPPGAPTPNPAFVMSARFPASTYLEPPFGTLGDTYVSQPFAASVPAGFLAVCFYWPSTPAMAHALEDAPANQVVTDSASDNFHFLFGFGAGPNGVANNSWCYGTTTAGGSLIVTVNTQTPNAFDFEGAVLSYTGDSGNIDQTTTTGAVISSTGPETGGTITTNIANELILSIASSDGTMSAGANWNSRFCAEPAGDDIEGGHPFCVEDAIGPSSASGSVSSEFYIVAGPDDEYEAAVAGLY